MTFSHLHTSEIRLCSSGGGQAHSRVGSISEVTVASGLTVDRLLELEFLNDNSWAEVKVLLNDLGKVGIREALLDGTI